MSRRPRPGRAAAGRRSPTRASTRGARVVLTNELSRPRAAGESSSALVASPALRSKVLSEVLSVRDCLLEEAGDMRIVQLVDLLAAVLLGPDEAEVPQHSEVLRHCWLFHVGFVRELLD